jgi:hypothetical protein
MNKVIALVFFWALMGGHRHGICLHDIIGGAIDHD